MDYWLVYRGFNPYGIQYLLERAPMDVDTVRDDLK